MGSSYHFLIIILHNDEKGVGYGLRIEEFFLLFHFKWPSQLIDALHRTTSLALTQM